MSALFTLITGPAQSGKTAALLERYRRRLIEGRPGEVLWLSPTWRAAVTVRERLLSPFPQIAGCFQPGIMTFAHFAHAVLEAAPQPIRPLSQAMKRQLVRQILDDLRQQGRLAHFLPIAGTSGLIDLACQWLSEMKRLEIWPEKFQEACLARGQSAKDRDLLEIYAAYQQALGEHGLFDAEGRFWSARDFLAQAQSIGTSEGDSLISLAPGDSPGAKNGQSPPRPFEALRFVAVDGFTDFTRTQHEILELLAGWVEEIVVTLPLEPLPRREDLFSKTSKTLDELQRRHANCRAIEQPRPTTPSWPAMDHVERRLFSDSRESQNAPTVEGLEILAAAGPLGEMEMIASRIKRLLIEDRVRPGEVAVVFRAPQDPSGLAGEVFARYGIPVAWQQGPTLDRNPLLRALAALLRSDLEDRPERAARSIGVNSYFTGAWDSPVGNALGGVQDEQRPPRNAAEGVPYNVQRLFQALPQRATLAEWAGLWRRLAEEAGAFRAADDADRAAWGHLEGILRGTGRLAQWLDRRPPELDRRQAYQALVDILGSQRLPAAEDDDARVRIFSADTIRALHVPYLFVAGLSEKSFPQPDREDRFYNEAEYLRLIEAGLPLIGRAERNREEMLLFYEVITRATKRLYLSYPAFNESAEPLSPSPFLTEVEQACGATRIVRTEADDFRPLPKTEIPLCPADFRVQAVARALEGDASWLAGMLSGQWTVDSGQWTAIGEQGRGDGREARDKKQATTNDLRSTAHCPLPTAHCFPPAVSNLWSGLETAILRQDRRFGPADGLFFSTAAEDFFRKEFSPQRTFAVTDLERYATCPFRFLLERVLKIEPPEDLRLQADVMQRGQIVHAVLAEFHRQVNQTLGRPGSPAELEPPVFDELMRRAFQSADVPAPGSPLRAAMAEIDRRMAVRWLADYRRQAEQYDRLWTDCEERPAPELFEISFGPTRHPSANWAVAEPMICETPQGTIRVAGRIDRVDTGRAAGHAVFNIIDYKTGSSARFSKEAVLRGTALQLPIYAIAVPELFLTDRDPLPWQAGYWIVSRNGFQARSGLKMYQQSEDGYEALPDWDEIRLALQGVVGGLVRNLRQGCFPVFNLDEDCTGTCPFRTVCRINAVRALEKTWHPPGENPVQNVE